MGLASFYRRLVPKFAEIAKPLTILTRKDQQFTWSPIQQETFRNRKDRRCTTPMLAFLDSKLLFIPTTDASKTALGHRYKRARKDPLPMRVGKQTNQSSRTQPRRLIC